MTSQTSAVVVAVDGPAGSGKSSVSRGVASRLGWRYLDTGAMYRAITWALLDSGISVADLREIARRAASIELEPSTDPASPAIRVAGHDVSAQIRTAEVTSAVSAVSAVPEVREVLLRHQREEVRSALDSGVGIVVEGRDIGTVVIPDAQVKVFLTADAAERARRRDAEGNGDAAMSGDIEATRQRIAERDRLDSTRAIAPLAQAPDAVVVDTTHMSLDEVIDTIVEMAHSAGAQ